ncbi:MAG: epoxyqueuosine reductase QueH [Candidatus Berkelbacteria bacterium]|nr:epoxyqueuosine reductase QueH [Candidatus Berkelbacteria bacterium]
MKKILLHSCCAPCTAGVIEQLKDDFEPTLFWYNPNIFPQSEHDRRLNELLNFADDLGIKVLYGDYDYQSEHKFWLKKIAGFEDEPERGRRCEICYRLRLEATAEMAAAINKYHPDSFDLFGAELSISPHKDSEMINIIGEKIGKKYHLNFLSANFKQNDGFKKSLEVSKSHNLYRQNYCGCEFSRK